MPNENNDIINGFSALAIAFFAGVLVTPILGSLIFLGIAIYFFRSGGLILFSQSDDDDSSAYQSKNTKQDRILPAVSASTPTTSTLAEKMTSIPQDLKCPSCGANIKPTDKKCNFCGSSLVPLIELPEPAHFGGVQIDQTIRVTHPEKGQLTLSVRSRMYYGELWQEQMRPNVPWTLTGNYYVGLMLDQGLFLLNWQDRFYLLNSNSPLTDMQISRDFSPYAREFAASNQTAEVHFRYGGEKWHMDDIGKFRIEFQEGDKTQFTLGAIGRFIHASSKDQVLVIEDYESGGSGGRDTLWKGSLIKDKEIEL